MSGWLRSRKGYVVALQWLLLGVVAAWGAVSGASRTSPMVFWSLVLLFALGNLALSRMPLPYFFQPAHLMHIFTADTVFVGAAIYCMVGFDSDLYLPYFLILLSAAITRTLARSVAVALGVSVVYTVLVWREGPGLGLLDTAFLIRLPFFIAIALFTSYLAHGARMQEEATAATRALAEQVTSLQQIAAGIAHEVRNPLTAISNTLEVLQARMPERDRDRELVRDALGQVGRVTRIVQETLDLARPAALRESWMDVQELLARTVGEAARNPGMPDVRVVRRASPVPLMLWGDELLLGQALLNVVRNAVEAMPAGGTVEIDSGPAAARGRELILLRIRDTGRGIPPHQLARLFQPFYTTKPEGTGLGLCLARKAVRAHGGELAVESAEGRGTTVRIELPLRAPAPPVHAAQPEPRAETPAGR